MVGCEMTAEEQQRLLARHEPVLAFTEGEMFFPVDARRFVETSGLWLEVGEDEVEELVPAGELTMDRLVEESLHRPGASLHLRFVDRPLRGGEYRRWHTRPDRPRLTSRGRFTKVGVWPRLIDALFRIGLVLRGRIPGGFAAAAEQRQREVFADQPPAYHGRVLRDGGYVVLQYWFLYVMNDWRSTFAGVNDHEGDWELVTVYLVEDDGMLVPRWVGLAAHDETGPDLRRRWDDPELTLVDGAHPVVHIGAGSHAATVVPGDYVVAVDPPVLRPLLSFVRRVTARVAPNVDARAVGLRIPYVDYKRGDGRRVGPGQPEGWHRVLIDDHTPWVRHFRGLWGLDTRDRFGGERAPAGPRFERSGIVRRSWADPLGWVGLHTVAPNAAAARALLERRTAELDAEQERLDQELEEARDRLRRRHLAERVTGHPRFVDRVGAEEGEAAVAARRHRLAALDEERRLITAALDRDPLADHPHAHLAHRALPWDTERNERERFLRIWATVSSPLLVAAFVLLVLRPPGGLLTGLGVLLLAFSLVEAVARRRALAFLRTLIVVVALVAGLVTVAVLGLAYWRIVASVMLGIGALALLMLNLSDLRRR
jgi:hypothetical protein